eukprot:Rhum_TRINITY_DN12190_c4_g1::Rhum_TRINITY_DN12190_c4_g1_i1::g.49363::m.49363
MISFFLKTKQTQECLTFIPTRTSHTSISQERVLTNTYTNCLEPPLVHVPPGVVEGRERPHHTEGGQDRLTVVVVVVDRVRHLRRGEVLDPRVGLLNRGHASRADQLLADRLVRRLGAVVVEQDLALEQVLARLHLVVLQTHAVQHPVVLGNTHVVVALVVLVTQPVRLVEAHDAGVGEGLEERVDVLVAVHTLLRRRPLVDVTPGVALREVAQEAVVLAEHLREELQRHNVGGVRAAHFPAERHVLQEGLLRDAAVLARASTRVPLVRRRRRLRGHAAEARLGSLLDRRRVDVTRRDEGNGVGVLENVAVELLHLLARGGLQGDAVAERVVVETRAHDLVELGRLVRVHEQVLLHDGRDVVLELLQVLDARGAGSVNRGVVELGVAGDVREEGGGLRGVGAEAVDGDGLVLPVRVELDVATQLRKGSLHLRGRLRRRSLQHSALHQGRHTRRLLRVETGAGLRVDADGREAVGSARLRRHAEAVVQLHRLHRRVPVQEVTDELRGGAKNPRVLRHRHRGQGHGHCDR